MTDAIQVLDQAANGLAWGGVYFLLGYLTCTARLDRKRRRER